MKVLETDRLILRRANKLVPHIEWPLGRIFRYYINENKVEIKIRVFQSSGNSISESFALATPIKAVDPLFLMTNNCLTTNQNIKKIDQNCLTALYSHDNVTIQALDPTKR